MKNVLEIFEQLCAIPHGSGNTKQISDFCVNYAKKRGLKVRQDRLNNVVIYLPATPDRKDRPAVVLQGHLDMVCEKEPTSNHDFEADGLKLRREGDWLMATDTTLGGDDGIAIAYCLALLDEKELSHPDLELFFTVDEETGMDGAIGFDPAWITGRRLINVDSEEEGQFIVSAAGGRNVVGRLPLAWEPCTAPVYEITVDGLQGGHSGAEIHQCRANANIIMGKILNGLNCRLINWQGGQKANAIPRSATVLVAMEEPVDSDALTQLFRREYGDRDPGLTVTVKTATAGQMLQKECSDRAVALLAALPDGVQKWSEEIKDLVETSLNCGIIDTDNEFLTVTTSLRSMKNAARDELTKQVTALMERHGFVTQTGSEYPAWEYRAESPLRDTAMACYQKLFGKKPVAIALHAGLECGLLSEKLEGLDVISMGPDMKDIHTPRERLSIPSAERTWELLKELLKTL